VALVCSVLLVSMHLRPEVHVYFDSASERICMRRRDMLRYLPYCCLTAALLLLYLIAPQSVCARAAN
jgi:hypothetical protein